MAGERATASLIGGVTLLERAINYILGSLHLVTPAAMLNPTPCSDWNLRTLLRHLDDSLVVLHEAVDIGHLDLDPAGDVGDSAGDLVAAVRGRCCSLLGGWVNADGRHRISVAELPLASSIVASTGALELAVHGWDVAQACGYRRPLPPSLAQEMLELSPLLVTDADRPVRFAAPIAVSPLAATSDRLLAFLGRAV